jgi:molecular chaperone DnaK
MTITASTKLPKNEVERMIKQAKEHEEEDKKRREETEVRNNADSLIYTTEKTVSELGDKLSREQKEKVESALKEAKASLQGKDLNKIKQDTEKLQKVLQEAGASIYQEATKKQAEERGKQTSGSGETDEGKDRTREDHENVVDADFKVEEEK